MEWTPAALAAWYKTPAGSKVVNAVREALARTDALRWNGSTRPLLLEVGYAKPYYKLWPNAVIDTASPASLGEDGTMECRYDRLVLAHALEDPTHGETDLLERCWQALRPDGYLIVIVPASFSLCRLGKGPFAAGRCFTANRLITVLSDANFHVYASHRTGAGAMVAVAGKQIGGTKALAKPTRSGKVVPVPAGIATFKG